MLQDGPTFGQLAEAAEATGFDKAVAAGVKRLPVVWDEPTRQGWVAAQLARKAAGADSLVDASLDVLDEVTAFPQPVVASCTAPFLDLSLPFLGLSSPLAQRLFLTCLWPHVSALSRSSRSRWSSTGRKRSGRTTRRWRPTRRSRRRQPRPVTAVLLLHPHPSHSRVGKHNIEGRLPERAGEGERFLYSFCKCHIFCS